MKSFEVQTSNTRDVVVKSIRSMQAVLDSLTWEDPACYAEYLAQTYFYVRHATRVLAKAAWRCNFEEEPLHKKLLQGINEEKNHELMCTSDLEHVGYDLKEFTELPETSAYYQTLYAMIDAHGPYALLGYFVSLEGLGAIGFNDVYNRVVKTYGKGGAQFIEVHAHLDQGHFEEGLSYILTLPEAQQRLVAETCIVAGRHYESFLKGLGLKAKAHPRSA
jgi:pyrroloquinoline quinone (PQQ) biosynthesis protein C